MSNIRVYIMQCCMTTLQAKVVLGRLQKGWGTQAPSRGCGASPPLTLTEKECDFQTMETARDPGNGESKKKGEDCQYRGMNVPRNVFTFEKNCCGDCTVGVRVGRQTVPLSLLGALSGDRAAVAAGSRSPETSSPHRLGATERTGGAPQA